MTTDLRPKSVAEAVKELSRRLYVAEQQLTRPLAGSAVANSSNPSVDTITIDGIVVGSAASPATNLILTTGAHMEDIWIDADWDAPADGTAAEYDVELARKVGGSYELVQNYNIGGGTSLRMSALEPQQTYGVRVTAINRIQTRSTPLPSSGFSDITTGIDATIPAQVTGVALTPGIKTVMVTWDEVADRDVARGTGQYEVQLDTVNTFTAPVVEFTSATIISFVNLTTGQLYYARVRAVDNSGNAGAWSSTVSGTTGQVQSVDLADTSVITSKLATGAVNTSKLADLAVEAAKLGDSSVTATKIANLAVGSAAIQALAVGTAHVADASIITAKIGDLAVTTAKIADLSVTTGKIENLAVDNGKIANLDAGKINAGTISADRIAANSLDVNKLTTSTLTSKTITIGAGGVFKIGDAPTTGVLINDQGIRLYSGGSVKVALDVAGTASFEGNINASTITSSTLTSATINAGTITGATIRTASSGKRIELTAGVIDELRFYTGSGSESAPGRVSVGAGADNLNVDVTAPRTGQNYGALQMASRTSNSVPAIAEMSIRDPSGNIVQSLRIIGSTASVPGYLYFGEGVKFELGEFPGSTAVIRLVGSGDYGFLYLQGGGAAATLNVNNGLGAGLHVLNGTNATFHPIQASAFTVSSAASTKREIRSEGEALSRLQQVRVVRFKRDYPDRMENPPKHIQRFYDLEEIGFLADELLSVMPEAVALDSNNQPIGINLAVMVALLVKSVQEIRNLLPGRT